MPSPLNSSSSSSNPQIISSTILSLVKDSEPFTKNAGPILKAYQNEENAGFFGRIFYALRDFFASFAVFIEPSPKVRLIRLIKDCQPDLHNNSINDVASAILHSSKFVVGMIEDKLKTTPSFPGKETTLTLLGRTSESKAALQSINPLQLSDLFALPIGTTYSPDEKGFTNLGSTCFMNSSIRLFLSKKNIEDLICVSDSKKLICKSLNKRDRESQEKYEARQKLLSDIVSLHFEVKKETSNVDDIKKWLHAIGSNPIFEGKLRFFRAQEDAHEFLSIVMDALELDNNTSMSLKLHKDLILSEDAKCEWGVDQALPIVELYSKSRQKTDPSSLLTENLVEEVTDDVQTLSFTISFRHPNLETLKSLMIRMPRFDGEMQKTPKPIQSVFESFNIKVFDETKQREVTLRLNPKSAVCHIGPSLKSGHYVVIVKDNDKFFQKSDTLIKELTKQQAESYAEEKVYLVDYDVEVVDDEVVEAMPSLGEA
jgi:hypothetical protein